MNYPNKFKTIFIYNGLYLKMYYFCTTLQLSAKIYGSQISSMESKIKVDSSSKTPVYKQLIAAIQNLIASGELAEGAFLPSMNGLSDELQISKETVKKTYSILREKGLIDSSHGKGFYVKTNTAHKIKILLIFDKLSTYKQVLYNSFVSALGDLSEITILLHNQDIALFQHFVEGNLDNYDYYIVAPHFPLQQTIQKKVVKILSKIPNRKLLLVDRNIEGLNGKFGAVYQDFEKDIYNGLSSGIDILSSFKKLNVISMPGSLYAPLIKKGIETFCIENGVNYEIHHTIDRAKIKSGEVFLILNSQLDLELIELAGIAKEKNYKIGTDIGVISYNESPINEIILNGLTVFSTNFKQMGHLAAQMILDKNFKQIHCEFNLIRRSTF
ncbi:GntR family transcriptional regulator [Pedobacter hiemivivus]|nr:GntR family transcriptional regulator [Pedobacter hiemivivus]